MAAAFRNLGTRVYLGWSTTGSNSLVSTINVVEGDLLIAIAQRDDFADLTSVTSSVATMTPANVNATMSGSFGYAIYTGIAGSTSSSATITATFSGTAQWSSMVTAAYSGIASATPLDTPECFDTNVGPCALQALYNNSGTYEARTDSSFTPSEEALIVAIGSQWNNDAGLTTGSGWTKRFDGTSESHTQFIFDQVTDSAVGGTAPIYTTGGASDDFFGAFLSFEIASTASASSPPKSNLRNIRHLIGR